VLDLKALRLPRVLRGRLASLREPARWKKYLCRTQRCIRDRRKQNLKRRELHMPIQRIEIFRPYRASASRPTWLHHACVQLRSLRRRAAAEPPYPRRGKKQAHRVFCKFFLRGKIIKTEAHRSCSRAHRASYDIPDTIPSIPLLYQTCDEKLRFTRSFQMDNETSSYSSCMRRRN
jgi:hypothetical protein